MKKKIRLTESQLNKVIKNCVKKIISESYNDSFNFKTDVAYINIDTNQMSITEDDKILEGGRVYEVTLEVADYDIENDGIGSYEFWGQTGYDKGVDYPVITKLDVVSYEPYGVIDNEGDINSFEEGDDIGLTAKQENMVANFALNYTDKMRFED